MGATVERVPEPAVPAERDQAGAWRAVPILVVLQGLSLLDRQVLTLMVAPIKRDLAITDFQIGLLQGLAFAAFYSIAALPIGWLVDRFPRRPIIWAGVTLWGMAAAGCGLASNFGALLAARLGVGVGEATLSPASNSIVADLFGRGRLAMALSVVSIGSSFGNGLAMGLGGLVVSFAERGGGLSLPVVGALSSWQFVFLVTGAPGVLLGLLIFLIREPARRGRLARVDRPSARITLQFMRVNSGFFRAHFVGFGLLSVVGWSFTSWLPVYMTRAFGWSIGEVAAPLAVIIAVGGAVGTLISGAIVDRFFRRGCTDAHFQVFAVIALVMAGLGLAAYRVHSPVAFLALAMPIASMMTLAPTAAAALQIVTPNQMRGQVNALFQLIMSGVGLGVGPTLVGALTVYVFRSDARLGDSLSVIFAVFAPLAALVLWAGSRHMRHAVDRAEAWS